MSNEEKKELDIISLKPCICGSTDVMTDSYDFSEDIKIKSIECLNCRKKITSDYLNFKELAEMWNNRELTGEAKKEPKKEFTLEDLEKYINKLITLERIRGSKKHNEKFFYDNHQTYAVIKEELEELKAAIKNFEYYFENNNGWCSFWEQIKHDINTKELLERLYTLREISNHSVIEAIQLAAMTEKAIKTIEREIEKNKNSYDTKVKE